MAVYLSSETLLFPTLNYKDKWKFIIMQQSKVAPIRNPIHMSNCISLKNVLKLVVPTHFSKYSSTKFTLYS